MKKIVCIFIIGVGIILFYNSCHKENNCNSKNLGTVTFTSTDLEVVPYKGTETLIFSDSLGNTMIFNPFYGLVSSNDYHSQYSNYNNASNFCMGNIFYSENIEISFDGNSTMLITIDLKMTDGSPFYQNIQKIISINFIFEPWNFVQGFYFDGTTLYQPVDSNTSKISFSNSIKIGPKTFNSVYILQQTQAPFEEANLQYVYYTISQGIVGFKEEGGTTWYLKSGI